MLNTKSKLCMLAGAKVFYEHRDSEIAFAMLEALRIDKVRHTFESI
jgi:hypothetical protein